MTMVNEKPEVKEKLFRHMVYMQGWRHGATGRALDEMKGATEQAKQDYAQGVAAGRIAARQASAEVSVSIGLTQEELRRSVLR